MTHRSVSKTIVVGDIHGCRQELEDLLDACGHAPGVNLISVGDLVAKGPDSRGVVALVRSLGGRAVLGNHDAHVVSAGRLSREAATERGRLHHQDVAQSLGDDMLAWLDGLPLTLRVPDGK